MDCNADDLLGWKDFPKGLRVLLLDEDDSSTAEIRSKLEEMDYRVSTFCNESEALSAISNDPESFHIAIVEVSARNSDRRFKFLETVKDLPIIMTSNTQCLSTMMKCIALGAVEFLLMPLSEDKLRNIWQHVVHKAFNARKNDLSRSFQPIKESVNSMLHLPLENGELKNQILEETENAASVHENDEEQSVVNDKYPAPSTPQLKQGVRLLDDGDFQDQTNCSTEKDSREQDGESKSVETTSGISAAETSINANPPLILGETDFKEDESADDFKSENKLSPHSQNQDRPNSLGVDAGNPIKAPCPQISCRPKSNRKKVKVDWTPELHKKFVQAVEQLGVDQAIPSRILELMKVDGLTRHNVASHLQKYRMHRRHILPKEDDRRWSRTRDPTPRSYYPHRPVMAFPSYRSHHSLSPALAYPTWGPPSSYSAGVQIWGPPCYPAWQPTESWHWKPYPELHADAWGCPVMQQPPQGPCMSFPPQGSDPMHNSYSMPHHSLDFQPAEEVIDKVVREAISQPWLPLPLGLKPPSTESVLSELSRQGISTVPPHISGAHSR